MGAGLRGGWLRGGLWMGGRLFRRRGVGDYPRRGGGRSRGCGKCSRGGWCRGLNIPSPRLQYRSRLGLETLSSPLVPHRGPKDPNHS